MTRYRIERKIRGEWEKVSEHETWNRARIALDRLQNRYGANAVRWVRVDVS